LREMKELQAKVDRMPRVRLLNLPTPFHEMPQLTKLLRGPRLWMKRDDCTGLALGGNKERKAEFVMADALRKKADVVVTTGGVQSNHVRATAAAARKLGLKVVLVLFGKKPKDYDGNLLLDYLLGAELRFADVGGSMFDSVLKNTVKELEQEGHAPYMIPGGASYPVGAVAYVNALLELLDQAQDLDLEIDYIVHAAGSGGTQAGLVLANKALKSKIKIIGMADEPDCDWLIKKTVDIATGTARLLNIRVKIGSRDVTLIEDYAGEEYGVLTPEASETIKLVAQTEGIILDPVYTGKAVAGLIDMIRHNRFRSDDNVVFIHTGGIPALFPYRKSLKNT